MGDGTGRFPSLHGQGSLQMTRKVFLLGFTVVSDATQERRSNMDVEPASTTFVYYREASTSRIVSGMT